MTLSIGLRNALPAKRANNVWYRNIDTDSVLVFVHGIFSDSRGCWLREDAIPPTYWPALIDGDAEFSNYSIYLGGYHTNIGAGEYKIANCADELFRALERPAKEAGGDSRSVLDRATIVFVCHSTGGIVVRYLLDTRFSNFKRKIVGLVLIASPSYGALWANRLKLLSRLYKQKLGAQLEWKSWSLEDLDSRFKALVSEHRIPGLYGEELCEHHFVLHRPWWPWNPRVLVSVESAGRYFGPAQILPGTDHFTCVKPDSCMHPAYEYVGDFCRKLVKLAASPPRPLVCNNERASIIRSTDEALPPIVPQSDAASPRSRDERQPRTDYDQDYREQMLQRVHRDWIKGVLKKSFHKETRIRLGLVEAPGAVEERLNATIRLPDQTPVPMGSPIINVFDDCGKALLILGAPGGGKTTLLLELAKTLLDRAKRDRDEPVPVVLNLSSWAGRRRRSILDVLTRWWSCATSYGRNTPTVRRLPLAEWLVTELNERGGLPKELAQRWVESNEVIPLLDGLDEVAVDCREECVEALNNFRRESLNDFRRGHGFPGIAVCSRITDYQNLSTKLRLPSAVEILPLTRGQVEDYLERVGKPLQAVRVALENDPSLWELLETPLMLWVATLAYQHDPFEFSLVDNLERRRTRLFAKFVDEELKRHPSAGAPYSSQQTRNWLSALAAALGRNHETVFYLEDLRSEWLRTPAQKWLSSAGIFLATWLLVGLVFGLIDAVFVGLRNGPLAGLAHGAAVAISFGLYFAIFFATLGVVLPALIEIRPIEGKWIVPMDNSRLPRATWNGLIVGAIFGLIVRFFDGPVAGEIEGPIVGLIIGLASLRSPRPKETRRVPNQGTHESGKVALAVLFVGIIVGLILQKFTGLFLGLFFGLVSVGYSV